MTPHEKIKAIDNVIDWLETKLNGQSYGDARGEVLHKLLTIVRAMRADIRKGSRRTLH
jgi:hypothetical protein